MCHLKYTNKLLLYQDCNGKSLCFHFYFHFLFHEKDLKFQQKIHALYLDYTLQRRIQGRARGARAPLFLQSLVFFYNHFEELQTVLFEVELIINNAPLTYVYPNTIETCLTSNHLLLGRQLLYSSNTTLTVVRNLTVFSSTTAASVIIF